MINDIQDCAAKVINVLSRVDQLNILRLAETLGERSILTYQALGWLAQGGPGRAAFRPGPGYSYPFRVRIPRIGPSTISGANHESSPRRIPSTTHYDNLSQ